MTGEITTEQVYHHNNNPTIESLIIKDDELDLPQKRPTEVIESPAKIEPPEATPVIKKSRKYQGVGIKKPLYSKYESLFIIKAYQKILQKLPNLILIDIFRIISILFNKESTIKGFKKRTSDQLYQKYKRIQYGLNHGEAGSDQLEFVKFFRRNEFNLKEWLPLDFDSPEFNNGVEDEDYLILKSVTLDGLDDAIEEILSRNEEGVKFKEETDDELLELAGYKDNKPNDLDKTIGLLEQQIYFQRKEIKGL